MDWNLQEDLLALQDEANYRFNDLGTERDTLEGAVEAVAETSNAIKNADIFDAYRSFLKHFDTLPAPIVLKLYDSISSGLLSEVEAVNREFAGDEYHRETEHKQSLEMFAFLLQWFASAAERHIPKEGNEGAAPAKAKGRRGGKAAQKPRATNQDIWSWDLQIPNLLSLISRVLRDLQTHRLYNTTAERDALINCITRPAWRIAENEGHMKIMDIKLGIYKIICHAVKKHGHTFSAQISIMQALQYFEHLSEPMAEVLSVLQKEFDHTQLAEEILREISTKTFNGQDSKTPRSFSRFISRLADLSPRIIYKQFSVLRVHLDSDAYPIRIALVEVVGVLIREIAMESEDGGADEAPATQEGSEKKEKKINKLFDLLLERFCDVSSYVRVKVINTISKLCELPVKLPKQRNLATPLVIAALEDKASSVRRYAIALLTNMIVTHPYGAMYGGFLNLGEWEQRYKEVKEQLTKLEAKQAGAGSVIPREEDKARDDIAMDEDNAKEDEDEDVEDAEGTDEEGKDSAPRKRKRKKAVSDDDDDDDDDGEDGDGNVDGTPVKREGEKKKSKKARHKSLDPAAIVPGDPALDAVDMANITRFRLTKRYIADAVEFIREVEGAMDTLGMLLASKAKAEVLECIEFFKVAYEYQMQGATAGIKRMLHLIWTKDNTGNTTEDDEKLKGVRSRLIECYRGLYFDPIEDADPKQQTNRIAKNMIDLTHNSTLAELTSLEELMRTMYDDGRVDDDVIATLWAVYSADREIPRYQRRGAIIVLGMFALAKRDIIKERTDTLLKVGLGPLGKTDMVLAQYTCLALQRLSGRGKKIKGSLEDKTLRLPMDNIMFRRLQEIIEHPCSSKDWFSMAEQAINTIYLLGEQPDALCSDLIKSMTRTVFSTPSHVVDEPASRPGSRASSVAPRASSASSQAPTSQIKNDPVDGEAGNAFQLSQLLFLVGHVAFKHVVYLELVERELKRRKELGKEKHQDLGKSVAGKEVDELEQVAGNAEDDTADRIREFSDDEMLYGETSLLAVFGPILVHICGTPKKYKSRSLRTAATLALCKFMCVSTHFCEANLMLLFKILETSKDPTIRSNAVIALGDVAVRFSHLIDENNNKLYEGLSDKDIAVKKNTLMVLTYLILGSMIKVKGQLGEMAKCVEDEDSRIADLAKLFFNELSANKDNAIYNNLPDVISHLSIGDHALDEEGFQQTMRFIFTFIEKEKQAESIVEKLCQRFRLSTEPRQWRDVAFCLSLLPFKSERSVKKLIEGLPSYQDKLHEETVYNRFNEILTKARANKSANKPDNELKEFEAILKEHKEKGEEEQALEASMQKKTAAARKRAATRKKPATRSRKAPTPPPPSDPSDDEEEEDSD